MNKRQRKSRTLKLLTVLIVIPAMYLILWPISFIGDRGGRTRGNTLQSPVRSYQHKETGRRVILVGICHIGKKTYYQKIQSFIDRMSSEGFQILYEDVGIEDDENTDSLDPETHSILDRMSDLDTFMREASKRFFTEDIVYQTEALEYRDSWIRTDVTATQIATSLTEIGSSKPDYSVTGFKIRSRSSPSEEVIWCMKKIFTTATKLLPGFTVIVEIFTRFKFEARALKEVVITMRDEVATLGILEYNKYSDVLSIWGAGHISGIHKHLLAAGYQPTTTEWYDVM